MSLDAFDVRFISLTGCTPEDCEDFHRMSDEGKVLKLEAVRASLLSEGRRDTWAEFVAFLGTLSTVAADVMGLGAVVTWARSL